MKFRIQTQSEGGVPWWEDYDKEEVKTQEDAMAKGKEYVEFYNRTLRPGEKSRVLLNAEIVGEGSLQHKWRKTNLVTIMGKGMSYDTYECERCHCTAKKFGLGEPMRDKNFSGPEWAECRDPALIQDKGEVHVRQGFTYWKEGDEFVVEKSGVKSRGRTFLEATMKWGNE